MKVVGIIAEYNPFHNGHAYQIKQAKKLSHADYCIVAMSGNYVQRGIPAITDKFSRAAMALQNGADMVFELPTLWATASAEYFAAAGIALFNALGCVDTVCFGCETLNLPLLTAAAEILATEPELYTEFLSSYLKEGLAFPAAREKALFSYIERTPLVLPDPLHHANTPENDKKKSLSELLASPNNILALEYMKALIRSGSSIQPLPILRKGSGYHALDFDKDFCSATAIRSSLLHEIPLSCNTRQTLSHYLPKETAELLFSPDTCFLSEWDFSSSLYYKLLSEQEDGFTQYADVTLEFSNKIAKNLRYFTDYQSFCNLLKSKDITYARISRMLLHILLNIKATDYQHGKACGYIPYLRPLGFCKEASSLFTSICSHSALPIVTRPAKDILQLDSFARDMLNLDIFSSNLYYGMATQKSGQVGKNEYQQKIVIFS